MDVVRSVKSMRDIVREWKRDGEKIGFVPTMGYLHKGHISLIKALKGIVTRKVVSIFVNPIQFCPGEDFERYPRDEERDLGVCREEGVDVVFIPSTSEMYPEGFQTYVEVENISKGLCGTARPGHFRGVATVVCKLFNIIQPDVAVFGRKDAQQALLIQRMVKDLNLDVDVIVVPTVREEDGLAMSSRNMYLSPEGRRRASAIFSALRCGADVILGGERDPSCVARKIRQAMEDKVDKVEYIELRTYPGFAPMDKLAGKVLVATAVWIEGARLIDNIVVDIEAGEIEL